MKKALIILLLSIAIIGCTPSDVKIQASIEKTQTAQPTSTMTPEPTPDYKFLQDLTYEDAFNKFLQIGVLCSDRDEKNDGSYSQECNWVIDDGMVQGKIFGKSENTVSMISIMFIQFIGKDVQDEMKNVFLEFVDFGENSDEMQSWVSERIEDLQSSTDEHVYSVEISNIYLILSEIADLYSLDVIGN